MNVSVQIAKGIRETPAGGTFDLNAFCETEGIDKNMYPLIAWLVIIHKATIIANMPDDKFNKIYEIELILDKYSKTSFFN